MHHTKKEHREAHIRLHIALDELVADMIRETTKLPSKTTVMELIQWSSKQIENPDDIDNLYK